MEIIIVGCGKVGSTLAEQLSREGHDISIIDMNEQKVDEISNICDAMGFVGNGGSYKIQLEAGIEKAHLMIAVTGSDELNLLCCLIARKAGNCKTIARVRNPIYSKEIQFIKEELGLERIVLPVGGIRNLTKKDMKLNDATPEIRVDPQTYDVTVDGELITCEPASELPLAQRYFLF